MNPYAKPSILVTGSSGLIGSAVVERLAPDFDVIGFDLEGAPYPPAGADPISVDLGSDESVLAGLDRARERHGDRIASVIHLAAYYSFSGDPSPLYRKVTVDGTKRLLQGLKREFVCEQFLFSSTMLVHAPCNPGQKIDEKWPLDPQWDYPRSKVQTEDLLRERHGSFPLVILRIAGVYNDRCHSIPLAHQIQRIHERRLTSRVFPGDISHGQSFVHLDDLVDAIVRAVERRGRLPEIAVMLIGERETLSYDELQRQIGRLLHGEEWETKEIPKAVAKTGAWLQDTLPFIDDPFIKPWMIDLADQHFELDIGTARRLLGWEPKRSLAETLPKMIAALEADPLGWYRENGLEPSPDLQEELSKHSAERSSGGRSDDD